MSTPTPSPTHPPETNLGIVTSWLPLTTAYSAPSSCSSKFYAHWSIPFGYDAVAFDPEYGMSVNTAVSCLPSQATKWWNQAGLKDTKSTVVSLGPMQCPEQYSTVATSLVGAGSTFVACCPSAYKFVSLFSAGSIGQCTSPIAKGAVYTYGILGKPGDDSGPILTLSITLAQASHIVGVPVNGYVFPVPTTTSVFTTTALLPTATISNAATTSLMSLAASSTLIAAETQDGGLSAAAKAGIGIGATLAGLALFALVGMFMWKLRRNRRLVKIEAHDAILADETKSQSEMQSAAWPTDQLESGSNSVYELDGGYASPMELDAGYKAAKPVYQPYRPTTQLGQ